MLQEYESAVVEEGRGGREEEDRVRSAGGEWEQESAVQLLPS